MISVIIPVYNRTALLPQTIESVLGQRFQDWELVIVDDGSAEDVLAVVRQYDDHRISYLRQDNQGNAVARNTGIKQSRGEYVICLDSDDLWHHEMLGLAVSRLAAEPAHDVIYTRFRLIDALGNLLDRLPGPEPLSGDLLEPILMGHPILPSSALTRRESFERWGPYTPGFDDWEMWLRWAAGGCQFYCLEEPLLYYRVHPENFNLDLDRRRQAHFAMLNAFYQRDNLPQLARQLRDRAYANQHFHFAELAFMLDRQDNAIDDYKQATVLDPSLLNSIDHYTRLACAHQGRIDAGSERGLDLNIGESTIQQTLEALTRSEDQQQGDNAILAEAYAWAYLSLARLAYGVANDMDRARHFLLAGLKAWPPIVWRSDWSLWYGRSVIGRSTIRRVKGVFRDDSQINGDLRVS